MAWMRWAWLGAAVIVGCPGPVQEPPPTPRCTTVVRYADADRDGFGAGMQSVCAENAPPGLVERAGDCDDGDSAIHPAGFEVCGGADEDCDGVLDEGAGFEFVADGDGDGYGSMRSDARTMRACTAPEGFVRFRDDCDDRASTTHPMASERCDDVDQDCNGLSDDDPSFTCRLGESVACRTTCGSAGTAACAACVGPAASCTPPAERCNAFDDDCDGLIDDGVRSVSILDHTEMTGATFVRSVGTLDGWIVVAQLADGSLAAQTVTEDGTLGSVVTLVAGSHASRSGATRFDVAANDTSLFVSWSGNRRLQLLETSVAAPAASTPQSVYTGAYGVGDTVSIALLEEYIALTYVDPGRSLYLTAYAYDGSRTRELMVYSSTATALRPDIVRIADEYAVVVHGNGTGGVAARAFWFNGTGSGYITQVSDAAHVSSTSGPVESLSAVQVSGARVAVVWSVGAESTLEVLDYTYASDSFSTHVAPSPRAVPTLPSPCAHDLTMMGSRVLVGLARAPAQLEVESVTSSGVSEATDVLDDDVGSITCRTMQTSASGDIALYTVVGPSHVVSYRWGC
ncbi:MAG: putative metal-binding motif-containing protein [Deltaproteobacteria bacterium]|nr:putative metal-binding motif-containing protein [Deltaproteobacteria bacterium]